MVDLSLTNLSLPMASVFGLVAGSVYLVSCFRHRHGAFTFLDAMLVIAIMGVVTAVSMPVLDNANETAQHAVLEQNLRTLRQQIERYKIEHEGKPPLLFQGGLPQLVSATNSKGIPGPRGDEHPLGPYLPGGIPMNPLTGSSLVESTEVFPPTESVGRGGWFYHQTSGHIAPQKNEATSSQKAGD